MITDELLRRFKDLNEWSRRFHEAIAAAATEEEKRAVHEQFKNEADAEVRKYKDLREWVRKTASL